MSDDIPRDNIENENELVIEIDNPLADSNLPGNVPDSIDGIGNDLPENYNEDNASEISHEEIPNIEINNELINETVNNSETIVEENPNNVDEETIVEEIPNVSNAEILFLNKVILDESEIDINVDESKIESEIKDIQQSKLSSSQQSKPTSQLTSFQVSTQTSKLPSKQTSKIVSKQPTPISSLPVSQKVSKQSTPNTSLPVSNQVSRSVSKVPSIQVSKAPSVIQTPVVSKSPSQQVSKAPSVVQTPFVSKPNSQRNSEILKSEIIISNNILKNIEFDNLNSRKNSKSIDKRLNDIINNNDLINNNMNNQEQIKNNINNDLNEINNEILNSINTTNIIKNEIENINNGVNNVKDTIELDIKNHYNTTKNNITNGIINQLAITKDKLSENFTNKLGISSTILEETEDDIKINAAQIETNQPVIIVDGPRKRRVDRQLLANDLSSELPITLRYNENVHVDNEVEIDNYTNEWTMWVEDGLDKLDELIMLLDELENKYKSSSRRNKYVANSIQFLNLLLGSGIVYVQSSTTNAELIRDWNTVAGGLSTISTMIYNYFGFAKKTGQYASIASNIYKLNCWIKSKLILPVDKRFSPFDIYIIGTKALQVILEEAQQKKQDSK